MKFYNRENQLGRIQKEITKLEKRSSLLVLSGRRRIGKTRLVLEACTDCPSLYFFVGKKKMSALLREWTDEINDKIGNVHGEFSRFSQLLEYLFSVSRGKPITVFFDEVQNFLAVDPSVFSDLQKGYDVHREESSLMLIFAGSSYSLMEKIFTGAREPLFGRATEFIRLGYLPVKTQKEILADAGMYSGKNLLHAFSIFDGIPRFYEEIVETGEADFEAAFRELLVNKEFLWEEGFNMMREEFGKDYAIYHSILSSIATGKRTRNEIEQYIGGSAGGYLQNLENLYLLIRRERPVLGKQTGPGMKRYYFADNFYEFWFRFISRFQGLKEINRKDRAFEKIRDLLPEYEGYKLENLVKRIFIELKPFDLDFTRIGRYWDRKGENEIDLVLLDEDGRKVYMVEIKRNFSKAIKGDERRKFSDKVVGLAALPGLKGYTRHLLFAGIEDNDLVIMDERDNRFVL